VAKPGGAFVVAGVGPDRRREVDAVRHAERHLDPRPQLGALGRVLVRVLELPDSPLEDQRARRREVREPVVQLDPHRHGVAVAGSQRLDLGVALDKRPALRQRALLEVDGRLLAVVAQRPPKLLEDLVALAPGLLVGRLTGLPFAGCFLLAPLPLYAFILLVQTLMLAGSGKILPSIAAEPLIVLAHLLYGWGFWRGLFTKLDPPGLRKPVEVTIERVSLHADGIC